MFSKSKSKSERMQSLGERMRLLRISRTRRILLDNGCERQPLLCAADQELDREQPRHSLTFPAVSQNGRELLLAAQI